MKTSAAVVATLVLLCTSPAAAVDTDDDLLNETATPTPDGAGVTNLTDDTVSGAQNETATLDRSMAETGETEETEETVGSTVDAIGSTVDAVGDGIQSTVDATTETLNETGETLSAVGDATLDDAGEDPTDVAASLESATLVDAGTTATGVESDDESDAGPALTTASRGGGGGGATMNVAPPGARPGDDASTGGGVPVAVGTGALLVGVAARGDVLAGGASSLSNGGVAGGTLRAGLDRLLRWVVPLRYSRYDGSDPLEHEDRAQLLDAIEAQPGTYLTAVADGVDLPLSTARHHLRVLEREGLVERATLRGKRRLFPAHAEGQVLAAALADEATAGVLEALARVGPCSTSELAAELDRDTSTMSHHLQRLAEDDLVVRERDGRALVAHLAPEVAEVLAAEPPGAPASSSASAAD